MSNSPPNGYTVRLVYYGRANLTKNVKVKDSDYSSSDERDWVDAQYELRTQTPQIKTQNIRIVAFSSPDSESFPEIAIYELVKNAEAPKSDLEGTKI